VGNIISGVIVIGIGIANGGSVFTGDPSGIDYAFDLLGIGLILYGIFQMATGRGSK
jgi:hypothetical protein